MSALQWLHDNRQWTRACNIAHAQYRKRTDDWKQFIFWQEVLELLGVEQ